MSYCSGYQTKQGELILYYLSSLQNKHITAEEIIQHFDTQGIRIGRATVYRHLDKLVQKGQVRKYTIENNQSACYQFVDTNKNCNHHLHLKCKECGELFHVESDILESIQSVLQSENDFEFDSINTVFYGKCKKCSSVGKKS